MTPCGRVSNRVWYRSWVAASCAASASWCLPVVDLLGHLAHQQQHPFYLPVRAAHRLVKALNENLFRC